MIAPDELLANNFFFPRFGSYLSFELHMTVCHWRALWTLVFGLGASSCAASAERMPPAPEFSVRTLYDGHAIAFSFCGFREFCGLERFLEFLDLNIFNIKSERPLRDRVFGGDFDPS